MGFHVFIGQHHIVNGAKACISNHNTGKMQILDNIFQLDFGFIKADRAENAATALHSNIIILGNKGVEALPYHLHFYRMSLNAGSQVRGIGIFVYIMAHGVQILFYAGTFLDKESISWYQGAIRTAVVATHGGLVVGWLTACLSQLLDNQAGNIGLANVSTCSCNKNSFTHVYAFYSIIYVSGGWRCPRYPAKGISLLLYLIWRCNVSTHICKHIPVTANGSTSCSGQHIACNGSRGTSSESGLSVIGEEGSAST